MIDFNAIIQQIIVWHALEPYEVKEISNVNFSLDVNILCSSKCVLDLWVCGGWSSY